MLSSQRDRLISYLNKMKKYPELWNIIKFINMQKFVSALSGQRYKRRHDQIEIDITYDCNLKCFNCNRSCGQAPSDDRISLEQIHKFIQESTAKAIQWKLIRILGGEATLHPEFLQILDELITFKNSHCPGVDLQIVTNGFGRKVHEVLKKVSSKVLIENSAKKSPRQKFILFNLAPQDFLRYRYVDYSIGCGVPRHFGMGLSPYGYYPCAVAAGIDRVFGFDIGRKSLPELSDDMRAEMNALCRYCGFLVYSENVLTDKSLMSKSWRRAYENYQISKPRLTYY